MVLGGDVPAPSTIVDGLPPRFDPVVLQGLQRDPDQRFATAREMAAQVEKVVGAASHAEVGEWVERVAIDELRERANRIGEIERSSPERDVSSDRSAAQVRKKRVIASTATPRDTAGTNTAQLQASADVIASESTSQVSHLAMVQNEQPLDRSRRRTVGIAAAVLIVCAIGATLLAVRPTRQAPAPATSSAAAAPPKSPAVTTLTTATAAAAAATPPPNAAPPVVPTQSAPLVPLVRSGRGFGRQSATFGRPDCTPPYTTDAKGHVHFKQNCVN